MQVRINLKPTIFREYSRAVALLRVKRGRSLAQSSEVGYGLRRLYCNDESVRVYSIQKIRCKFIETGEIMKQFHDGFAVLVKEKKRVTCTQTEVVYYDIPVSLLKVLGKKVEQGNKTWRFV